MIASLLIGAGLLVALAAATYALFRLASRWGDDRLEAVAAREAAARDRERRERLEAATIEEFRRAHQEALDRAGSATGPAARDAAVAAWHRLRQPPDR